MDLERKILHVNYSAEMEVNPYPGLFVVVESLDGGGQSTQIRRLFDFFSQRCGLKVQVSKEPTSGPYGGAANLIILKRIVGVSPLSLQLGFSADRADDLEKKPGGIEEDLKMGKARISDRYFLSTLAYGYATGLDIGYLLAVQSRFILPDLYFYLDVPVEVCLARMKESRGIHLDLLETEETLKRAKEGFDLAIQKMPGFVDVIAADDYPDLVTSRMIIKIIKNRKFIDLAGSRESEQARFLSQ